MVLASSQHPRMQAIIAETARLERVGLFSRFSLEHDPEKLADFSDKITRKNEEKESAIDSTSSPRALVSFSDGPILDRQPETLANSLLCDAAPTQ